MIALSPSELAYIKFICSSCDVSDTMSLDKSAINVVHSFCNTAKSQAHAAVNGNMCAAQELDLSNDENLLSSDWPSPSLQGGWRKEQRMSSSQWWTWSQLIRGQLRELRYCDLWDYCPHQALCCLPYVMKRSFLFISFTFYKVIFWLFVSIFPCSIHMWLVMWHHMARYSHHVTQDQICTAGLCALRPNICNWSVRT